MLKLKIATAVFAIGLLASCGDDGNGGGLSGACATLLEACDTCTNAANRALCIDVAEDEVDDDCAALLALDPCDIL